MEVISSSENPPVLPPEFDGINVNFCKNPHCRNFGVPAEIVKFRRKHGSSLATTPGTAYTLDLASAGRPSLRCMLCSEKLAIKSNLAVAEELARFTEYLGADQAQCCRNPDCANHSVPVETPHAYYRFSRTKGGPPPLSLPDVWKDFLYGRKGTQAPTYYSSEQDDSALADKQDAN